MKCLTIAAAITVMACFAATQAQSATIRFTNFNDNSDAAYGVRDANGVLVGGSEFQGAMGYFTVSNSAIIDSFAANDLAAIGSAFTQFDPVQGNFPLNEFASSGFPGVFQASETFDTKTISNTFGGRIIYAVLFKGTSIATASELFIAELNAQFPTDPAVGDMARSDVFLRPDSIANLLVGTTGGPLHDYGNGGGALSTFGLVAAVPEPTRTWFLLLGLMGACLRRRR